METSERRHGESRNEILKNLLYSQSPLPVDQIARDLEISRNATYQHITVLERDGLIEKAELSQTRGRPGQTYQLTEAGYATFPKHYALFANLLVTLIKSRQGAQELEGCLVDLGQILSKHYADRIEGLKPEEAIIEVTQIMRELGYESEIGETDDNGLPEICAHNCVFHSLARQHKEVCSLDTSLISTLLGTDVEHTECMVRGGRCCRFRIKDRNS